MCSQQRLGSCSISSLDVWKGWQGFPTPFFLELFNCKVSREYQTIFGCINSILVFKYI